MGEVPAVSSGYTSAESGNQSPVSFREQDGFLPIANISRIMKKGIPQNGKIAKDSKEFVQECVSEFVSFITSEYVTISMSQLLFIYFANCRKSILIPIYVPIYILLF